MLNDLARKKVVIVGAGSGLPKVKHLVDAQIGIHIPRDPNTTYTVTMPKPRPEGDEGNRRVLNLTDLVPVDALVETFRNQAVEDLVENTKAGGNDPQEGPLTPLDLEAMRKGEKPA